MPVAVTKVTAKVISVVDDKVKAEATAAKGSHFVWRAGNLLVHR